MQTARPPRHFSRLYPHLCPGDACAVCTYLEIKTPAAKITRFPKSGIACIRYGPVDRDRRGRVFTPSVARAFEPIPDLTRRLVDA